MITDVVVATLNPETLRNVLPVVHTSGFGHVARVLATERGDLRGQLKRMGVPAEGAPAPISEAVTLLVLSAAARSAEAAGVVMRAGASAAWIVTRHGEWKTFDDTVRLMSPTPRVPAPPVRAIPGLHDAPAADLSVPDSANS